MANVVLFVATVISPSLVSLLGLTPALFLARPWTIVTNLFVHGDIGHILVNMLSLYFFGNYLISLVGEKSFFLVYFLGGIAGNLVYLLLGPSATVIGASGAIFAVGGALTALRPQLRVYVFPIPAPMPLWVAVIGSFLILTFIPYVAWQAHFGGLVLGLAVGYFFLRKRRLFV